MIDDRIRSRIEKLLNLSMSDNEHEAKLALEKAIELMQMHNITREDVARQQFVQRVFKTGYKNLPEWIATLYSDMSRLSGCVFTWGRDRGMITGRERDVVNAEYLSEFLIREIDVRVKAYRKKINGRSAAYTRSLLASYRIGIVRSVVITLSEKQRVFFNRQTNGNEIVPVDDRYMDSMAFLKEAFGNLKTTTSKATKLNDALRDGYLEGDTINLNPAVSGQNDIAALGV